MADDVGERPVPRDAGGRFALGGPGRPVGTRNRVSARVARMILRDFEDNAEVLLPRLRRWFAPQYLQLVGRLLPRDADGPELEGLSEAEMARMAVELRDGLAQIEGGAADDAAAEPDGGHEDGGHEDGGSGREIAAGTDIIGGFG